MSVPIVQIDRCSGDSKEDPGLRPYTTNDRRLNRRGLIGKNPKLTSSIYILLAFISISLLDCFPTKSIHITNLAQAAPRGATVDSIRSKAVSNDLRSLLANELSRYFGSNDELISSDLNLNEPQQSVATPREDEKIDDELCSLSTVTRRSVAQAPKLLLSSYNGMRSTNTDQVELVETALTCLHVDEINYRAWFARMSKTEGNRSIQQVHILNSDPMIIFPAIDLICSSFNCSSLTVFNITGQQIQDCNNLAFWLFQWPHLEILDLSNTSLKTIESVLDFLDPSHESNISPLMGKSSQIESTAGTATSTPQSLSFSRATISSSSANIRALSNKPANQQEEPVHFSLEELTELNLDLNGIIRLDFDFIFDRMPNVKYLSLANNNVSDIHCSEHQRSRLRSQFERINLANNSINCDATKLWFLKQFQTPLASQKFPDYDQIRCNSPILAEMTWSQRVSVLETKICDDCECRSLKRTAIEVDCHNKNLTSLPDVLPLNTKVLNLTSNRISSMRVPDQSKNWENVTYLHLDNNLISSLDPLELSRKIMRNLAALNVKQNKLQEFPSNIMEQFNNLDQIQLSNNPWLCDCESTFAFQEWVQRHFHKVSDKEEIKCGISGENENGLMSYNLEQRLSGKTIYKLSKSELCPQDSLEGPYDLIDVLNVSLCISIVLTISKVIVDYFYQYRTKRLPHFFRLNI